MKLVGDKKRLANSEEFNMIIALAMPKTVKMNKRSKAKAINDPASENDLEYFNLKNSISERNLTWNENMAMMIG